ncbi:MULTISPECIES: oligosaccharide flippase family protein [unclassified Methylophaga]|uniref:oligosaccharide flippase family protein n=1 Tax=unclassified Methylophaga TaxID=2629249 RepID=UPI00259CEB94|nr:MULTISPECIES: oligosaccharide flippase family protein [unclassified Methylophaga]
MPNSENASQRSPLKKLIVKGSLWTIGGYGLAQLFRLASNVIMAKFLFPEAFGLMTLVMVFMQGISMFSDIGITPSIIQNKRGNDQIFLNTAWTIQVFRGFVLWAIALVGAYPYSILYNEPLLAWMLPVASLSAIIAGFNSTSLASSNRDLNLRNITLLELIAQFFSISVMILWVVISPTVWGLVVGGLVNALVKMLLSQFWIAKTRNRFQWEREAASSLFKFGRWVLASTALTFFARQIDRILLGYLIGAATLGVYSIAAMFKETASKTAQMLGSRVLFPSYSRLIRENDHKRLYIALRKARLFMIVMTWSVAIALITLGNQIIDWLYDARYDDAIWMVKILPLDLFIGVLSMTYHNVYLAKGKSSYISFLLFYQLIIQVTCILVGYNLAGTHGVVIGLAVVGWLLYPANVIAAIRLKIWQPEIDIPVIALAILFITAYLTLSDVLVSI